MPEISEKKKKFLESLGLDINNLPPEFEKHSNNIEDTFSKEEIDFLNRENLTGREIKTFSLKNLVGTVHPNYSDKTWLEAFLISKRGDRAVDEYFKNPEYYSTDLKQLDQSNLSHETPLELYESDGRFFINGGNNRLSLIMMKYLAEMSKAQTDEERAKIDEDYTFVAEVQSIPKDKDIMYMLNMLRENYGQNAYIRKTSTGEQDFEYTIKTDDKIIKISSKEELEQALRDTYQLDRVENLDQLKSNIIHLIQDEIVYRSRQYQNRGRILEGIFPNLQQFQESVLKLRKYGIDNKLYDEIDLQNIDFSQLCDRAIELVEIEENRIQEEQQRKEQEREEKAKIELKAKSEQESEKRKKNILVGLKRKSIEDKTQDIPSGVEKIYYELKQEEIRFYEIAKKLGLSYSITRTDDTNIYTRINDIKRNMQSISEQIQRVEDPKKLDKVSVVLQELEQMTQDGTITAEHTAELKETFEKSFDSKVQDLIRNSKLSRLEQEREKVENEKVSIIGKILGKGKLKQAKLENIDLKIQLFKMKHRSDKHEYSLEDSLSDLYVYSQCELGRIFTTEMQEFLSVVKGNPQLRQMIDQHQLQQQFNDKVNNRQNEKQLVPIDRDKRISNRHMAHMLQLQNNEMSRQIQNNRATTVTRQNNLSCVSINKNSALNRFQSIVNEIELSTQTKSTVLKIAHHQFEK